MTITIPREPAGGRTEVDPPAPAAGAFGNDGWIRFGLMLLSRAYLAVVAALAAITLLPTLLGWQPMIILSGSMEPTISPGDVVLVADIPEGESYRDGMVVAFESAGVGDASVIKVHRIVETREDGFVTRGDANRDPDSGIRIETDIRGAGRILVPYIGLPAFWLSQDMLALVGWILGTLVTVGLAVAPSMRSTRTERVVIGALSVAAIGAWSASPITHAHAAFTMQTSTSASWSVATSSFPTIGRAGPFSLLAATSVSDGVNTSSDVAGSIGTTPGTTISHFTAADRHGSLERDTPAARDAMTDARALATALEARPAAPRSGNLSGRVAPGVYSWKALHTSSTITLDAAGDPRAQFVFIADSLAMANNTNVVLANGATATNVFWRVHGAADLRTSTLRGTVIADGSITANAATVVGRLVSLNGSISATRYQISNP